MNLIIVESPTKAKTISKFLGNDYVVRSSYGHVRDLPKSELGVDTANNFKPKYVSNPKSEKHIAELKSIAADADKIILASDEDREGEAISWHLIQILNLGNPKSQIPNPNQTPKSKSPNKSKKQSQTANLKPYERIVFHEITKTAIEKALASPRQIDMNLVDAQQARRVLDRLVGYELSPFLWKKIRYGLSAGRVQSVAVRLIVEREEEINKFRAEEYWETVASLLKLKAQSVKCKVKEFEAKLVKINGDSIPKLGIKTKEDAEKIKAELEKSSYRVLEIKKKEVARNPLPPFTTSTLQQAASNLFGYSAKQTMMIAQQLYEGIELGGAGAVGLITYMRTDSLNLSEGALAAAKAYIGKNFGARYTISNPRRFKTKSKGAQEAHEAIRPANPARDPESVKEFLDSKQFKLYRLIWQRMLASQMASAVIDSTSIDIGAKTANNNYILRATGSIVKFDGFLKVYPVKSPPEWSAKQFNGVNPTKSEDVILPELEKNEKLDLVKITNSQHFTQPPARYSEAGLIKALEEFGIGRPSTYAPTISTIQDRGYAEKKERRFYPKEIGIIVNKVLVEHFPEIVDIKFTARMEENLDEIAENKKQWVPVIKEFYGPFKENLLKKDKEINKKDLTEEKSDEKCPKCGSPMIIKLGRFGKFLACANYPDCKTTKPMGEEKALKETYSKEKCSLCGAPMNVKFGRFGAFLGCSKYPECKNLKKIEKTTGIKCPKCGNGEIIEKMSKRKRAFYGCNKYPKCDYAAWKKPTQES